MERYNFDVLVIGAGVVGLSIARSLCISGKKVLVVEKREISGDEVTSRNSGVIHGGMYYDPGSLKASLCLSGNKALYQYCKDKKISHERTGKLIIATSKQEHSKLLQILNKGKENGVELDLISSSQVRQMEPEITCYSAIYSPNTGIIDVSELVYSLEKDIEDNGGLIALNSEFQSAKKVGNYFNSLITADYDFHINSDKIVNCTGLSSAKVSRKIVGLEKRYIKKISYGKGHYFKYHGSNPFKSLIYPLPNLSSLGVHVSWDISKQLRFGPDFHWVDEISYNFKKDIKSDFVKSIKTYWPNLNQDKLQEDYCGIRPKLALKDNLPQDFYISSPKDHNLEGLYNLQGIESPGLTSSLAIGDYLCKLINKNI